MIDPFSENLMNYACRLNISPQRRQKYRSNMVNSELIYSRITEERGGMI